MLELNHVYNMDCMEGMCEIPDKYFELAIVDPPYGIGVNHNMGRRKGQPHSGYAPAILDSASPDIAYFEELRRISENQIVWGANHFISKMPFDSPCWVAWDKGFSPDVSFAQFELAWTSFDTTAKKYDASPNQPDRIHPAQKPVDLYKWLLTNYAKPGDKILDTHVGSGSSIIACMDMGFDFLGFEIDADYYKAMQERIYSFTRQTKLGI